MGRDQPISEDTTGLTDKNDDILRKQLKSYSVKNAQQLLDLGFNSEKLAKVDGNSFHLKLRELFEDNFPGISLESQSAVAAENDKYQKDGPVPRDGILKSPEMFFGGGWSEAGPTTVQGASTLHDNGPGPGADDMANYRDEKAAKSVLSDLKLKKKIAVLLKLAFQPPTEGMDIDNSLPDHEDPDKRRMTAVPRATNYKRTTRVTNMPGKNSKVKRAQGTPTVTPMPANNPVKDFSKRMRNSMANFTGSKQKAQKTPPIDDVRGETSNSPRKVPRGHAELDTQVKDSPAGSDAKVAHLLQKCFR
jgi:hypothetical protein